MASLVSTILCLYLLVMAQILIPYGDASLPITGDTGLSGSFVNGQTGSFGGRVGKSKPNSTASACIASFSGLNLWERSLILGSEENVVISLLLGALLLFLIAIVTMTSILCVLCRRTRSYTVNSEV